MSKPLKSLKNSHQIIRDLKKCGVVALPGFFPEELADRMRTEAINLLNTWTDGVKHMPNPGGTAVRLQREALMRPGCTAVRQALSSTFCRDIAYRYDPKSTFLFDVVITHNSQTAKISDIHFDMKRSLKFMIYLSDVNKKTAAFRYCSGSHLKNRRFRYRFLLAGGNLKNIPNIPAPEERIDLVDIEGLRGTLVIFDTDGFHSAGVLQPGSERLLIRSRALLSSWTDTKLIRKARNIAFPMRDIIHPNVPAGRRATGGTARKK